MAWFPWRRKNKDKKATVIQDSSGSRYVEVGGRRHLADAPYVLPHDDQEINRLDFQHYMLRYALRGNYAAPIGTPASILDVGSGTGRWAMEMAAYFPDTNVVATDIVVPPEQAAQPAGMGLDRRPENYTFVPGNVLNGLSFADGSFDFVHMRLLIFAIPEASWPKVVNELVRVTRPGGWIELVETGPQQNGGPAMDMIVDWVTQASQRRGVNPLIGPRVADFLAGAGAVNVNRRDIALPVGAYGGRIGKMAETDIFGVMGGVKPLVTAQGIASDEAYTAALTQARADINRFRCTLPFYLAYGQRPR
ncbi:MAG: class I SAM-dependent methyltransferase [Nitrososphaerota archaeon]